jgi:hypothetical protein
LSLNSSYDATISVDGTTKNKYINDTSEQEYGLYIAGGTRENGKSMIFTLSTTGDQKLVLTYATHDTGTTGFTTQTLSYSIDGGLNYSSSGISVNNVSGNIVSLSPSSSYSIETVDFSSVTALNDRSSILIQLSLSGAPSGTTGSDHFDNIQFNATPMTAVPEPAAWGAISGLGLIGICGLRTWRQRRSGQSGCLKHF